jgi:hypothetical protein
VLIVAVPIYGDSVNNDSSSSSDSSSDDDKKDDSDSSSSDDDDKKDDRIAGATKTTRDAVCTRCTCCMGS